MTGAVILAAGASTRLGRPKQLLEFGSKTLIQRAVDAAAASGCTPIVVVLGANAETILTAIQPGEGIDVVINEQWQQGMGSSIQTGIGALLKISPEIESAMLMVVDQPFTNSIVLRQLINKHKSSGEKSIVASFYDDTVGVPAVFGKSFFEDLLRLSGQEGAKKLFYMHRQNLFVNAFPLGSIDIDTADDFDKLLDRGNHNFT